MSIELHCPQCQKLIRAPESGGGKHGKCPYCGNSVYVPMPPEEGEEIRLAPIDESEEQREAELRREAAKAAAEVDHGRDEIPGADDADRPEDTEEAAADMDESTDLGADVEVDMEADVEAYVLAMGESRLDEADAAAERLKNAGPPARQHVQELIRNKNAPAFGHIPPPVVQGFLRTLLDRLR